MAEQSQTPSNATQTPRPPPAWSGAPLSRREHARRRTGVSVALERFALPALLVLLFAICAIVLPAFRSTGTLTSMINSQAIVLMLALTATIVLRTGDFDLSIAAVMVASAAVVAVLSTNGASAFVVLVAALGIGLAVGVLNGLLVVWIGVDSFITTLGAFTALTGLAYALTNSRIVAGVPDFYNELARARLLSLPMTTWYAWVLVVVLYFVYERTPLGRYMIFIGGNRDAARLAGIPVNRIRMASFVVSGLLGAVIGILLAGSLGAIDPSIGNQYLLAPFAAVFLGATTISVGRFNAFGTMIALYLLVVGITALQLLGADPWVSSVFNGLALILAVTLARLAGRGRAT